MHCRICKREITIDDYDMVTQSELLDAFKENKAVHPECKAGGKPPTGYSKYDNDEDFE